MREPSCRQAARLPRIRKTLAGYFLRKSRSERCLQCACRASVPAVAPLQHHHGLQEAQCPRAFQLAQRCRIGGQGWVTVTERGPLSQASPPKTKSQPSASSSSWQKTALRRAGSESCFDWLCHSLFQRASDAGCPALARCEPCARPQQQLVTAAEELIPLREAQAALPGSLNLTPSQSSTKLQKKSQWPSTSQTSESHAEARHDHIMMP